MSEFKEYQYILECKALLISVSTSFLEERSLFMSKVQTRYQVRQKLAMHKEQINRH